MNKTQKIKRLGWALTGGLLFFSISVQHAFSSEPNTPRAKTPPAAIQDRLEAVGGYRSEHDDSSAQQVTGKKTEYEQVVAQRDATPAGPKREALDRQAQGLSAEVAQSVKGCSNCPATLTAAAGMAMSEKNPEKAHGLADRAVVAAEKATTDPKQTDKLANALTTRGAFLEKAGEYERAHADAKYALKVKPGDMAALGLLNLTKGRVKAGTVPVAWPASPKPTNAPPPQSVNLNNDPRLAANAQNLAAMARLREARHLLDINDKNGALQMAQTIRSSDPGINAAAYAVQAQAWQVMGDLSKAVLQISEAIKLFTEKSDLAAAYAQRASYHNGLKNHEAAVADSSVAIENNPKLALAFRERSLAFEGLHEPEKALDDMNQAAALDKGFMTELGEQRLRLGRDGGSAGLAPPAESALHQAWAKLRGKAGGSFTLIAGTMGALFFLIAGGVLWFAKEDSAAGRFKTRWFTPSGGARTAERNGQDDVIGKTVGGHILIQSVRDRGGMGLVFNGLDTKLERPVAVKRLLPELQGDKASCARMLDEARTLAKFHHPNIVEIFEVIDEGDGIFIICPLIDGRTVHAELNDSDNRHLPPARILEILVPVGAAITYAHDKHVIHRDIKPSNIMTTAGGRVMVMDFGIARSNVPHSHVTAVHTIVGTPAYMAPEQAMGSVCKQSDVFALGVTVYQMATGSLPFGMNDLSLKLEVRPGRFPAPSFLVSSLSKDFDAVIEKALEADPLKRQKNCSELAQDVAAAFQQRTPPLA